MGNDTNKVAEMSLAIQRMLLSDLRQVSELLRRLGSEHLSGDSHHFYASEAARILSTIGLTVAPDDAGTLAKELPVTIRVANGHTLEIEYVFGMRLINKLKGQPCEGDGCSSTGLCITEYCAPCTAALLAKLLSKATPDRPNAQTDAHLEPPAAPESDAGKVSDEWLMRMADTESGGCITSVSPELMQAVGTADAGGDAGFEAAWLAYSKSFADISEGKRLAKEFWNAGASAARADAQSRIDALTRERDHLLNFKAYVHKRLDDAGIPTHPEGPHSKEGCRIGDRLDLALSARNSVPTILAKARELANQATTAKVKFLHGASPTAEDMEQWQDSLEALRRLFVRPIIPTDAHLAPPAAPEQTLPPFPGFILGHAPSSSETARLLRQKSTADAGGDAGFEAWFVDALPITAMRNASRGFSKIVWDAARVDVMEKVAGVRAELKEIRASCKPLGPGSYDWCEGAADAADRAIRAFDRHLSASAVPGAAKEGK